MNKPIAICNKQCMTGWHTLASGHELQEGFFGVNCAPLDAPEHIPAGSSYMGRFSKTVLSTVTHR